jgi:hypothetical protein
MSRYVSIFAVCVLSLVGCVEEQLPSEPTNTHTTPNKPAPETTPEKPTPAAVPVDLHGVGESELVPVSADEANVRPRKRMNVEQLDRALRRVTGGIGWDKNNKSELERLAATLGRPDYRQVVQEDLTPSPVFLKFLDDAARAVCTELVEREVTQVIGERVLMSHVELEDTLDSAPEKVQANLRALLLRYHGVVLGDDAPELETWRWLHTSVVHVTKDPVQAWRAVCIALINHPSFYSF